MTPDHYTDDPAENVRLVTGQSPDYTQPHTRTAAQKAQDEIFDQAIEAVTIASQALADALEWTAVIDPATEAKYRSLTTRAAQFSTDLSDLRRMRG